MNLKFFQKCQQLSLKSDHPKYQIGALLVKKGRIVSQGFNKFKTHSKARTFSKRIHAEHSIIMASKGLSKGCDAYIFRQDKNGTLANCRPCEACRKLLKDSGIEKVFYTENGGYSCFIL